MRENRKQHLHTSLVRPNYYNFPHQGPSQYYSLHTNFFPSSLIYYQSSLSLSLSLSLSTPLPTCHHLSLTPPLPYDFLLLLKQKRVELMMPTEAATSMGRRHRGSIHHLAALKRPVRYRRDGPTGCSDAHTQITVRAGREREEWREGGREEGINIERKQEARCHLVCSTTD